MTTVTAVTTRYLPNLRHLARICETDLVVLLDLAHMPTRNRDSFVNRNRIADSTSGEDRWLTVPILRHHHQPVNEVLVNPSASGWWRRHQRTIQSAYPGGQWFGSMLCNLLAGRCRLIDVNNTSLHMLIDLLSLPVGEIILESELFREHTPAHRTDIIRALSVETYVAGEVEIGQMSATGELDRLLGAGVSVETVGTLGSEFDTDQCVRLSVVHSILTKGVSDTSDAVRMIRALPRVRVSDAGGRHNA